MTHFGKILQLTLDKLLVKKVRKATAEEVESTVSKRQRKNTKGRITQSLLRGIPLNKSQIYELFQTGKRPSGIFTLLKLHASRSGVYKVLKRLRETGSALPKVRSTLSRRVKTPNLIKKTQEKIRTNPKRSIRKLASEASVSYGTMQTVLKIDFDLSPFKKRKAQVLSWTVKAKRLSQAKLLFKKLNDGRQPPVLWTDKKLLTLYTIIKMIG